MLFSQASLALLHPYLQCVHSAARFAKVGPLATVSSLSIMHAARLCFTVWLAEHLVADLFGIAFHLPPFPLYILVVGGSYSGACLQSSQLILFASCFFFHLFISVGFHYYYYYYYYYYTLVYFDRLPLNVFQCDWCPCLCCVILFYFSLCWGVGSWLGCGYCSPQGWFHPAGVGLLTNRRVVLGNRPPLATNVVNNNSNHNNHNYNNNN